MKFPFIENPKTGRPDEMITLTVITTIAATLRFLVDGVSINIQGYIFNFGHIDASLYLALLAPILGAHSFIGTKNDNKN